MLRYTKEHYKDVARLLSKHDALNRPVERADSESHRPMKTVAHDFADLFAADSPPTCIHCGDDEGTTAVCISANGRTYDEHLFEGGFDRTAFLRACGIKP